MDIGTILPSQCTRAALAAPSRKRALQAASELLASNQLDGSTPISARLLFDELMSRERLGSTGLGDGVAIPHCRMPCKEIQAAFLHLAQGVDFDAIDGQSVDLLFVLVVPTDDNTAHLEILANLARVFSNPDNRATLRGAKSDAQLFEVMAGLCSSEAA